VAAGLKIVRRRRARGRRTKRVVLLRRRLS
jgi:hypothetical protein